MSVTLGHDVNIYNGNDALIGAAKSCIIHKTVEMMEVADPTNPNAKKVVPGRTSWSATMNHLMTTNKGAIPLVSSYYTITYKVGSTSVFQGVALCVEAELTATQGNLSQGSLKLQGSGPLSEL